MSNTDDKEVIYQYNWDNTGWQYCVLINCNHLRHTHVDMPGSRGAVVLSCSSEHDCCAGCSVNPHTNDSTAKYTLMAGQRERFLAKMLNKLKRAKGRLFYI
jgi:hypothetical protein